MAGSPRSRLSCQTLASIGRSWERMLCPRIKRASRPNSSSAAKDSFMSRRPFRSKTLSPSTAPIFKIWPETEVSKSSRRQFFRKDEAISRGGMPGGSKKKPCSHLPQRTRTPGRETRSSPIRNRVPHAGQVMVIDTNESLRRKVHCAWRLFLQKITGNAIKRTHLQNQAFSLLPIQNLLHRDGILARNPPVAGSHGLWSRLEPAVLLFLLTPRSPRSRAGTSTPRGRAGRSGPRGRTTGRPSPPSAPPPRG